jgi:V8-like Glu-specific endopeptidase
MEPMMDAFNVVIEVTKKLIAINKMKEAFSLLEEKISPVSEDLATSILMNKAQFNALQKQRTMGLITFGNATVQQNTINYNLLQILQQLPEEIDAKRMLGELGVGIYKTSSEENLEKILGSENHLVKINWLLKGIQASKSVCQVVRADGLKGTGFVLKNGYLMTNFHVLPNKEKAKASKIIFDYEEDLWGNLRKTSQFSLEPDDISLSPVDELDYAWVKIRDDQSNPLSQWGRLELDTFSEPQVNQPVTIIQHPLGQTKQIALTANKIIGINVNRLLYMTDTEKGSSGSPVFNNDWKVIALHHAGKTEEDGGLLVDPKTGEKRGANEGILIGSIVQHNNRIS